MKKTAALYLYVKTIQKKKGSFKTMKTPQLYTWSAAF